MEFWAICAVRAVRKKFFKNSKVVNVICFYFQTNAYFLNRRSYDIMQQEPVNRQSYAENFRQKRLAMTLKDALLVALDTGRSMTGQYTVTYDVTTNKLIIENLHNAATLHVYPTAWLKANASAWNTGSYAG